MSSLNILDVRPLSDLQGFFFKSYFLSLKNNFIYLFIYSFGCGGSWLLPGIFSSCSHSLVAVCRLLTAAASLVAEGGL